MSNTNERAELIGELHRIADEGMADYVSTGYPNSNVIRKAAEILESSALELTRLRELARDAADAATQLQKQVLALKVKQVSQPTWEAERIDDYEIRVTSPDGESWRLRSVDRNDSFNNFIWRWAESMVKKGQL